MDENAALPTANSSSDAVVTIARSILLRAILLLWPRQKRNKMKQKTLAFALVLPSAAC
jgi:hypothetical protein